MVENIPTFLGMLEGLRGRIGSDIQGEEWSGWFGDGFVLMFADCEEAEDSGFCPCAAAASWAECEGVGDVGGVTGGPAV